MFKRILQRFLQLCKTKIRNILKTDTIKLHGVKLNINHKNITPELRNFFYNESYEGDEIRILRKCLTGKDVVLEIGAGIGFLSAYCAKITGSRNVYAYEANPSMIEKIEQTYRLNNLSPTLKNAVLTSRPGSIKFFLEKNFWSSSSIKRSYNAECIEVPGLDVNEEIKEINPSLLIVDIEGGEKDLLPKINFDKNQIKKILIEIHPDIIGSFEASKLLAYLFSKGFCLDFECGSLKVLLFKKADSSLS